MKYDIEEVFEPQSDETVPSPGGSEFILLAPALEDIYHIDNNPPIYEQKRDKVKNKLLIICFLIILKRPVIINKEIDVIVKKISKI